MSIPGNSATKMTWVWNGKTYSMPITGADILTLARAVEEEGYPQQGVAWALLQRAAWLRTQGDSIALGKLVQQYAQPVNPEWFPNGAKHKAELERLTRIGDYAGAQAEVNRAAQRPKKAAAPWSDLKDNTKFVITRIFSGLDNSPVNGAVHYWASHGPDFKTNQEKRPGMLLQDYGYGFGPGRNVFFAVNGSQGFGKTLKLIPGSGGNFPWLPLTLLVGGFFAWKWWG